MKKILLILLLAILGFGSRTMGQGTCTNATILSPTDTIIQLSANDSVAWFVYQTTTNYLKLSLYSPAMADAITSIAQQANVSLYSGNCNNLSEILNFDSLSPYVFFNNNLTNQTTYYIKVNYRSEWNPKLLIKNQIYQYATQGDCIHNCHLIANGDFSSGIFDSYWFGNQPFYYEKVSCWCAAWGSPRMTYRYDPTTIAPDNNAAYFGCGGKDYVDNSSLNGSEGIYQNINIEPDRKYNLNFKYRGTDPITSTIFKLHILITNDNFQVNNCLGILDDGPGNPFNIIPIINNIVWESSFFITSDISQSFSSNIQTPINLNTGQYKLLFYLEYIGNDPIANHYIMIDDVNLIPLDTIKPIIKGNNSNCIKYENHYYIQNYNPNYTYVWSLGNNNGIINNLTGGEITIDWQSETISCPYDTVKVTVTDVNGCSNSSFFLVYSCCQGGDMDIIYKSVVTLSGTQTLNNGLFEYIFNEDVIIDGDITFDDALVHMGPNTKIIVNPDAKLTITKSKVSTINRCCNDMWDGIYVENPLSELYINNESIIQNAQNAVVSINKGIIGLYHSTFQDNYRNVVIKDFSQILPYDFSPYPAIVRGCIFKGNISYLLQHPPYAGVQTFSGIETENILNLSIGEYITDPSYKNVFEKMYCGIKGVNSNLYSYNNEFIDIRTPVGITPGSFGSNPTAIYQPTAIHSVFDNALPRLDFRQLLVGGLNEPYIYNTISNSINGIYTFNQKVDISGNIIEAENYGIRNKDILDKSEVSYNTINSSSLFVSYGIDILNIQPTYLNLTVNDNIVFPVVKGIAVSNCLSGLHVGQCLVNVFNNHVFFHPDNYDIYNLRDRSGIISSNSDGIVISCNEVARLLASEPDQYARLFGINVVQTMHAQVRDNYNLHKLGAGINVYSNCNYSNYQCNSLKYNYRGFLFNVASSVTQQGTDLTNTDNYFLGTYYDSPTYRKFWAISPNMPNTIDWHVRYNPGFSYGVYNIPGSNPTINFINEVQNSSSATTACADCSVGSIENEVPWTKEKREEVFGKTVRNEVVYDSLNTEFTTYDQEMLYRLLKEDSSLMNMCDTSDIAYQQFYADNQNSNIGKIVETQELIKKGEVDEALLRNESVQDQKLIDYYMKEVNNIYLATYAHSNYQLSAQQIDFLTTIANLTPWEGGDAVFIARYMLDIDPNQLTADFAKAPASMPNSMESIANMAKLYPNPAKDDVMIAFEKATDSQGILEIYGFTGSVIQSQNLASGYQYISVSVKDLKPGIYFYRILLNNEVVAKDKLLIVK